MFRFAHPIWLLTLLALPVLILVNRRRARPVALKYSDVGLVEGLPHSARMRLDWIPTALRFSAMGLLVIAVSRPQSGQALEVIRGRGVDIVMAVDISGSMAALDFEPQNRLGAAKQVIDEFIAQRRFDRIGLVVFAREAFSQSPPTLDYGVLRQLLSEIELGPDLGLEDGTAIGLGIAQAATMLQDPQAPSRVVILLTDGVNNAGQVDPVTAARAAAALGVKIYTVGAARPGQVPMPVDDPLFGRTTRVVESEIDEETLRQIADETGGLYYRAKDSAGLKQIYEQINQLEKSTAEVQFFTRYRELAGWFLSAALGLLLLEFLLRRTAYRSLP